MYSEHSNGGKKMDILSLGKNPISPDQPAGTDVRYDADFESLQSEISKLTSPTETTDWKNVSTLASAILEKKSKDLLAASYLAVARIHTDGTDGLGQGLIIYRDILENFWESLYPPKDRMRGRISAVQWWIEKTESALKQLEAEPVPPEKTEAFRKDLDQIDKLLKDYLESPPTLTPVRKALDILGSPPDPAAETNANPAESEENGEETSEDMASEEDARKALRSAYGKVRQLAAKLQAKAFSDPDAYRGNRIAAWAMQDGLPPDTEGKTQFQAPERHVRSHLRMLRKKGHWETLLESAERELSRFIFWMDINRFVTDAFENLGEEYQDARKVVCEETAFLLHRLPGLENLSFSDGTPFANDETKDWLRKIRFAGDDIMPELLPPQQEDARMADIIASSQKLEKENQPAKALRLIQARLQNTTSKRNALLWRSALSQILLNCDERDLAMLHIEQMLQEIEKYRLEEWDPGAAIKGLRVVRMGFAAHSDETFAEKAGDILNRIARLDPAEALLIKIADQS